MSRPAVAALLSAALLSGCGTSLHARTYAEHGRQDGAVANLGGSSGLAVRNVHVVPPATGSIEAGSTAYVTGGLVNNGSTPDALVAASSDVAGSVSLLVDGAETQQVDIPGMASAPGTWSLALNNVTRALPSATYITVTLQFQRAGRVTLDVPVEPGDNGLGTRPSEQNPYGEK